MEKCRLEASWTFGWNMKQDKTCFRSPVYTVNKAEYNLKLNLVLQPKDTKNYVFCKSRWNKGRVYSI